MLGHQHNVPLIAATATATAVATATSITAILLKLMLLPNWCHSSDHNWIKQAIEADLIDVLTPLVNINNAFAVSVFTTLKFVH